MISTPSFSKQRTNNSAAFTLGLNSGGDDTARAPFFGGGLKHGDGLRATTTTTLIRLNRRGPDPRVASIHWTPTTAMP